MITTLSELHWKEVIGVTDGARYGYVGDVRIDLESGRVLSLVVPGRARFFGLFGRREKRIIPWEHVRRFGADIILVEGLPAPAEERRGRLLSKEPESGDESPKKF